ncbi:ABC type sugar transporter permease 2 [Thermococcus cleftensis]|uniref:ABC type sugar transporter permease 2 n=1 Tax=Thermococcus cleftensis (strain DSM 27260 / KACC 17922 / CL1) TaxID=163003 RepID=I3ZRA5_THECF|nr:ABC transporter permease [Thermococcus cleftensis]AFL94239.1 ABC type sugar transporter permease 2 [Thermococcus cleftensis]
MSAGDVLTILFTSLMAMVPIVLTSVGAAWSERAGVVSIGYEGVLLISAFFGAIFAELAGSAVVGLIGGVIVGILLGMLHGALTVYLKGDHVIPGIGINLLSLGIVPFGILAYWGTAGQHQLPEDATMWHLATPYGELSPMVLVTIIIAVVTWWVLFKTPLGLRVRAVGENPEAADALGINVERYRFWSTVYGHALAGLGGAFMSVDWLGLVHKTMSGGRGFIALANMVFSGWNPLISLIGGWLFGFFEALAAWLAPKHIIPGQFILMLPYIMTLIIVAGIIGRARPPKWDGRPYKRE